MKTKTFSAMWSDKLGAAILASAKDPYAPYAMEFHAGADFDALVSAVAQGIDSHLEAVRFTEFAGEHGRRGFMIEPASVPVLVRRLMELGDENAQSLASGICETLGIELI